MNSYEILYLYKLYGYLSLKSISSRQTAWYIGTGRQHSSEMGSKRFSANDVRAILNETSDESSVVESESFSDFTASDSDDSTGTVSVLSSLGVNGHWTRPPGCHSLDLLLILITASVPPEVSQVGWINGQSEATHSIEEWTVLVEEWGIYIDIEPILPQCSRPSCQCHCFAFLTCDIDCFLQSSLLR